MGYRSYEKEAGTFGKTFGARRGTYDATNVDPYAGRVIRPGQRQEDWQDILKHGERSDTDWNTAFKDNAQALRRAYAPRGDWAKRKDMDTASQYMYDVTHGPVNANRQVAAVRTPAGARQYQVDKAAGLERIVSSGRGGGQVSYRTTPKERDGNTRSYTQAQVTQYEQADLAVTRIQQKAAEDRNVAAAKWMAEYNRNLNVSERISKSEKRMAHREKFASMQISSEKKERKRTRDKLRSGTSGLSTGAGAGHGLKI
jgi:hypothetical protein